MVPFYSEYKNAHGVSLPIGRTVNEASFYFQHSYLSFEQGALCTTSQRLMKSLELVSLGEEVESNRNMSCALLITTLITSVKMNSGIAVALCICRSYWAIHTDGSWASKMHFRWSPISFFSPLQYAVKEHTHTHMGYVTRQQSDSSHLFILWYTFVWIRFSDPFSGRCAAEANEFMGR